jgi:hypothetical protein
MEEPLLTTDYAVGLNHDSWLETVNNARGAACKEGWKETKVCITQIGKYTVVHDPVREGHQPASKEYPYTVHPPATPDDIFQSKFPTEGLAKPGGKCLWLINFNPLGPFSGILAPLEAKSQFLDHEFFQTLVAFARANPNLVIFYHSWGGAATKNGLHAQTILAEYFTENANMMLLEEFSQPFVIDSKEGVDALWHRIVELQDEHNGEPFDFVIIGSTCYVLVHKETFTQIQMSELTGDAGDSELISVPVFGAVEAAAIMNIFHEPLYSLLIRSSPEKAEQILDVLYQKNFKRPKKAV